MRINITGFTANHKNTKLSNRKGIINFSNLIKPILEENGHIVDFNLPKADINIIFIYTLKSLNSKYAVESLELLKKDNCIIAFDDWNIKAIYNDNNSLINGYKFKSHPHYTHDKIEPYLEVLEKINNGYYKCLVPAYKNGNHNLLNIIGEKIIIDPSIYIEKDIYRFNQYEIKPVFAGLANKNSFLNKLDYDFIKIENKTEEYVFQQYCKNRIVMSPPHYHDGSGWWRNRYTLANKAKAIIVEDKNSIFGESYKISFIENYLNISDINYIFDLQNEDYNKTIMSKQEISDKIKLI